MQRDYERWYSPHLQRTMEFLWFGWQGRPLIVFPTSMGRFYENEDFHLVEAIQGKVEAGELQVVCVDGVDRESWYNYEAHPGWRAHRQNQYDQYLRWELIPYAQHRAQRGDVATFGASFGGYHAANLAVRYPDIVKTAVMFSGLFDIHRFVAGYWDDNCYFHCPTANVDGMHGWWADRLRWVDWILCCGEHDPLRGETEYFAGILRSKGVRPHVEIWSGFGHDWSWWRGNLGRFV